MDCYERKCNICYFVITMSLIFMLLIWNIILTIVVVEDNNNDQNNSADCYCVEQMTNIIEQIIDLYPDSQLFITLEGSDTVVGRPGEIRLGPNGKSGTFELIITPEGETQLVSICSISTITINNATYNEQITYLPAPEPAPTDCKYDCENAIRDALPVGARGVNIITDNQTQSQGNVIVNVPGMIVIETPTRNSITFVSTCRIDVVY